MAEAMRIPDDWHLIGAGLCCWFDTPSHAAGAELIGRIAALTGPEPDIDLRRTGVRIRIPPDPSHANAISRMAEDLDLASDPAPLQYLQLRIDASDEAAIIPFWRTVLDYDRSSDELNDPLRRDPLIRFRQVEEPPLLRNRIHLDVNAGQALNAVPGSHETYRCDYYVTAADTDGNEVCLPLGPAANMGDDPGTADWRLIGCALTRYSTRSFRDSAEFAAAVARLADDAGKALLVDLRPGSVTIDSGKDQQENEDFELDEVFRELARRIQSAAQERGLTADPSRLRFLQLAIDAFDRPAAKAFWLAVLGYRADPRFDQDIYDPRRLNPVIWFQQMDDAADPRLNRPGRIHLDLLVPSSQVQTRVDSALTAGGRLVDSRSAQWTVVDPEGNELNLLVVTD